MLSPTEKTENTAKQNPYAKIKLKLEMLEKELHENNIFTNSPTMQQEIVKFKEFIVQAEQGIGDNDDYRKTSSFISRGTMRW